MKRYLHEQADWPEMTWSAEALLSPLAKVRAEQGRLQGRLETLGLRHMNRVAHDALVQEVAGSSSIEGELLDLVQVHSSVARRLGLPYPQGEVSREVDGAVQLSYEAVRWEGPVSSRRLQKWQAMLFPRGQSGTLPVAVGRWRDDAKGPMQVVSGGMGRERIHFEAPAAHRVPGEMKAMLRWFNGARALDPLVRAGVAHLWFLTIHPFDDGNGRVARALTDLAMGPTRGEMASMVSLSAQILLERKEYYRQLELAQGGSLDVTGWLVWFVGMVGRAVQTTSQALDRTLQRQQMLAQAEGATWNQRQKEMVERLMAGFLGKLTTAKWAQLCRCSHDTALRDIEGLLAQGVLVKGAQGGRSTSYQLRE
jgi:Fic family protein